MRLIQFTATNQATCVGLVVNNTDIQLLKDIPSVYELALDALERGITLAETVTLHLSDTLLSYDELIDQGRLLSPFSHPDPAHLFVTGTGLTHLGSADTRASMHAKTANKATGQDSNELTDSMKMFQQGVTGGKPEAGEVGAQPEWFYKGDGRSVTAPGEPLRSPAFALDAGEEPEIVGCYIVDHEGQPWRIGYSLGNELSDHKTERLNYLLLAHSKLRPCSVGPELLIGELPQQVNGVSRILRNGEVLWEKPFVSGEATMCHSLANLEYHHFKYDLFCQPGDAHLHFFGTATLSFGDGIEIQEGDMFEIEAEGFGRPLRNPIQIDRASHKRVKAL
ncbi:MAG: FAH family protein [Natronospirillum sp.]